MKCDEVRPLQGPYLDSELDARTTVEIEQHLKSCAECANLFTEEAKQEAQLRADLNRGEKTATLWERIERSVEEAGCSSSDAQCGATAGRASMWQSAFAALEERVRVGWQRSRWAWSAMAAAWAVILVLHLAAPAADTAAAGAQSLPPASEVRLALKQKLLLSAGLAALAEPQPAASVKPTSHSPRSDRREENLKSAFQSQPGARTFLSAAACEHSEGMGDTRVADAGDTCCGQECPRAETGAERRLNLNT